MTVLEHRLPLGQERGDASREVVAGIARRDQVVVGARSRRAAACWRRSASLVARSSAAQRRELVAELAQGRVDRRVIDEPRHQPARVRLLGTISRAGDSRILWSAPGRRDRRAARVVGAPTGSCPACARSARRTAPRGVQTRRSQASAMAQPPPAATPCTCAMVGLVTRSSRSMHRVEPPLVLDAVVAGREARELARCRCRRRTPCRRRRAARSTRTAGVGVDALAGVDAAPRTSPRSSRCALRDD